MRWNYAYPKASYAARPKTISQSCIQLKSVRIKCQIPQYFPLLDVEWVTGIYYVTFMSFRDISQNGFRPPHEIYIAAKS